MSHEVEIRPVAAQPIRIVRGPATATTLPARIRALFDEFYSTFKGKAGLNIVYYPEWSDTGEFQIECGVQVDSEGNSLTPAGTVATIAHFGPYNQLKQAHMAIHQWVRQNNRRISGASWEVYGHWTDDPTKLRTDVYYLLAD